MSPATNIRDVGPADMESVCRIYAHHVRHGLGTSECVAPDAAEMERRARAIRQLALPYLVAVAGSRVTGFAFAGPFRPRPAYHTTVEDSVYVAPDGLGRGIGTLLLTSLIARCEALGRRRMVAMIGDSGNEASIRLHMACGFARTGILDAVFFKHARWVDVVIMARRLGVGEDTPP